MDNILARIKRTHNSLIAASRSLTFIYNDLPLHNLNGYDYDTQEAIDATLAAAEKVLSLYSAIYQEK